MNIHKIVDNLFRPVVSDRIFMGFTQYPQNRLLDGKCMKVLGHVYLIIEESYMQDQNNVGK